MTEARAVLAGTGISVPPLEVDNSMLARIIETSDEWIRERSGVATSGPKPAGPRSRMPGSAPTRSTIWSAPP